MKICIDCQINKAAKGRRICYSCKNKRYEQKHLIRVAYYRLKGHAKERDKFFDLTFEQFKQFCSEVEYISKKGRSGISYHIDRINEAEGYTISNIQVLSNAENVKKYKRWIALDEQGKSVFKIITSKPPTLEDNEDCPF